MSVKQMLVLLAYTPLLLVLCLLKGAGIPCKLPKGLNNLRL